jgi:hypothetical protein
MRGVRKRAILVVAFGVCGGWAPPIASAEDEDLRLLREPAVYTDVIDAFDVGDPFDLNFSLGYSRSVTRATIEREVSSSDSADATAASRLLEVAESKRTVNQLLLGLQVGLFRDLALSLDVPLVLSDAHVLSMPDGLDSSQQLAISDALAAPVPMAPDPFAASESLFDLSTPQTSATRSGVPAIQLGLAWGVTNQYRSPHLPTWVLALQTRIGTSDVLEPCLAGASCDPGISRGTTTLRVESRWSYRTGALEPFLGLAYQGEWATAASDLFEPGGDQVEGLVNTRPPTRLELSLGLSVVPWEDRMRFQRFSIDTTVRSQYVSAGRDYTPLFDVLGSSTSPYLTAPNYDSLASDPGQRTEVPFTGVTNTEAHGQFSLNTTIVMQAARYVRFGLGFGLDYTTPHLLTGADACNADVSASAGDPRVGSCSAGILNPIHRPVLDLPGNRFRLGGALATELLATATGQF